MKKTNTPNLPEVRRVNFAQQRVNAFEGTLCKNEIRLLDQSTIEKAYYQSLLLILLLVYFLSSSGG